MFPPAATIQRTKVVIERPGMGTCAVQHEDRQIPNATAGGNQG